jgi:hypothetical protein
MAVHEAFKNVKLTNLEIDVSALYLIAAPSTPEPVVKEPHRLFPSPDVALGFS